MLFVLPWFWVPMIVLGWQAFRSGWRDQMLACLAAPPIVVFALISAWSSQRVLYHWAAPGYLMLFPLLGRFVAADWDRRAVRATIVGTAALCLVSVTVIGTQIQLDWLRAAMPAKDPTAEGLDWGSLRDDLAARGLLRPGTVVGVPNWRDAGKIAHALGPDVTVICLNRIAASSASPSGGTVGRRRRPVAGRRSPGTRDAGVERHVRRGIEMLQPSAVSLRGRLLKTCDCRAWSSD